MLHFLSCRFEMFKSSLVSADVNKRVSKRILLECNIEVQDWNHVDVGVFIRLVPLYDCIDQHTKGRVSIYAGWVAFEDPYDALMFKLSYSND